MFDGSVMSIRTPKVKIAISIEKPLVDEIEAIAEEMKVSRSRVFSLAARGFVERQKSRKLLEAINAAYDDLPETDEEKTTRLAMRSKFRRLRLLSARERSRSDKVW